MKRSINAVFMTLVLILAIPVFPTIAADSFSPPYQCEDNLIEVMFSFESQVRIRNGNPIDLKSNALTGIDDIVSKLGHIKWHRNISVSEERLDELHAIGQEKSGQSLYNLNGIYRLEISKGFDIWSIAQEMEELPGILLARPVPKPMVPPLPPDYESQQGYLDPASSAPSGIDAEFAWTLTGGDGSGITICDLEYGWNYSHADLTKAVGSQINPNTIYFPAGEDDRHGTAVIGEMVSDNNGWGTTGISYGATLKTCGTYYGTPTWDVPNALAMAISALSTGDVILLEQQWDYYGGGAYVPIEWWLNYSPSNQSFNGVYAAIQTAVANGIHVIEAGGNGNVNTGSLNWFGNSGAIIVGAGGASLGPNADRQRLSFSSYGSRFDLQGWGENVVTTGDTGLYKLDGKNYWYTATFSGTSSASPIVAGAAACCVGYWKGLGWPASGLTPALLRSTLQITGTPQDFSVPGNIGPRPNLRAACSSLVRQEIEWADITGSSLANNNGHGLGAAWGDFDNDGDDDLYVACNGSNKLFRNDGTGLFVDVTSAPIDDPALSKGVAWADYDNDGDPDIYLANEGAPNKLFRNEGGGTFADVTSSPLDNANLGQCAIWGDYDNDGKVDIYLVNFGNANKLFHNDGGDNFSDATPGVLADAGSGSSAAWGDYDNDGDLDIYLANFNSESNKLFRNDGGGNFTDVTTSPLNDADDGTSVAWGDYDNDTDLDLYLVNNGQSNKLFRNDGGGVFTDVTSGPLGDAGFNFGAAWGDYDNDGDLDIYLTTGYCCNKLLRNDGGGVFVESTTGPLFDEQHYSFGAIWGDHDLDGDIDIFQANTGSWDDNKLFDNKLGSLTNHWLHVKLIGTSSNKSGIGARVKVTTGKGVQIREVSGGSGLGSQNSLTVEFGLASSTSVSEVEVTWPSGQVQTQTIISADQILVITEEGSGGCCDTPGDANNDGGCNLGDAGYIINYIFYDGPAPVCTDEGDANSDGGVNLGDAGFVINYIFYDGPAPVCP